MGKKKDQKQKQAIPYRLPPTTKKHWLNEGDIHFLADQYEEALAAFEQAILLDPDYAIAYRSKGDALRRLERYEEALLAY